MRGSIIKMLATALVQHYPLLSRKFLDRSSISAKNSFIVSVVQSVRITLCAITPEVQVDDVPRGWMIEWLQLFAALKCKNRLLIAKNKAHVISGIA